MRVIFEVNQIDSLRSAQRPNASAVRITCDMTERQVFDALLSALESTTGETWANWQREIAKETGECLPCTHEWYQGTCAHCGLPAVEYRIQRGLPV